MCQAFSISPLSANSTPEAAGKGRSNGIKSLLFDVDLSVANYKAKPLLLPNRNTCYYPEAPESGSKK
jgi:hypothetical protein